MLWLFWGWEGGGCWDSSPVGLTSTLVVDRDILCIVEHETSGGIRQERQLAVPDRDRGIAVVYGKGLQRKKS